jgi:hypothetical protein
MGRLQTARYGDGIARPRNAHHQVRPWGFDATGGSPVNDDEAALSAEVAAAAEAVFEPHDDAEEASVVAEMNSLYRKDLTMATAFVVGLVIVLPFIVVALWSVMPGTGTKVLLVAAAAVLLVYNVTSMLYLVRNYRRDKDFIYRRDVAHLRELRTARRLEKTGESA